MPVSIAAAALGHTAGCTLPDFLTGRSPSAPPATQVVDESEGLMITALPLYRLIVSPGLADSPSRLLVLQVRMTTSGDAALMVTPADLALTLPGGQPARIFDRARAIELLHRTTLGAADFSYLSANGAHQPGGVPIEMQSGMTDQIASNLLSDGIFISGQTLQGFVVVDTGAPLMSLAGASLEVTAHRLRDRVPVRTVYQLTAAPTPTEAP
jgi:hypothetical protein